VEGPDQRQVEHQSAQRPTPEGHKLRTESSARRTSWHLSLWIAMGGLLCMQAEEEPGTMPRSGSLCSPNLTTPCTGNIRWDFRWSGRWHGRRWRRSGACIYSRLWGRWQYIAISFYFPSPSHFPFYSYFTLLKSTRCGGVLAVDISYAVDSVAYFHVTARAPYVFAIEQLRSWTNTSSLIFLVPPRSIRATSGSGLR
jgi:hypothetical protein